VYTPIVHARFANFPRNVAVREVMVTVGERMEADVAGVEDTDVCGGQRLVLVALCLHPMAAFCVRVRATLVHAYLKTVYIYACTYAYT
jgi:hypothetical protein